MFIGRQKEIQTLRERFDSDSFELGIIYGQRRIGKTSLILESTKGYQHLYLLARDDGYQNNLSHFCGKFHEFSRFPFTPRFNTFDEFFDSVFQFTDQEKLILTIDELPYLAKAYPGILSYLQGKADELKREHRNIKILLTGSDISFMVDLLENKAKPLYQRSTLKIRVGPLCFSDAVKMLAGFDNQDKIKYLSIFGTRPYYLERIQKDKDFVTNIVALCFSASSILTDAPNMTLPLGYTSNSSYIAILLALANHKQKVKEIADSIRVESNVCSTYLNRMLEGESIERRETFNGNHKTNYYVISDPFIRFYYRLIYPYLPDIERGVGEAIFKANMSVVDDIVSHGFEDVVNAYMDEKNAANLLPAVYHEFKNYSAANSPLGRAVEIDGLAESINGRRLLAIEAKYKNKDLSLEVLNHLKESVSIFANRYQAIDYYLFSKTGFSRDIITIDDPCVHLVSLDDMVDNG